MHVLISLLAILSGPKKEPGFIVPLIGPDKSELYYSDLKGNRTLIFRRRLARLEGPDIFDTEHQTAGRWFKRNSNVALDYSGTKIFIPAFRHFKSSGLPKVLISGCILTSNGTTQMLQTAEISNADDIDSALVWVGWQMGGIPTIVFRKWSGDYYSISFKRKVERSDGLIKELSQFQSNLMVNGGRNTNSFHFNPHWVALDMYGEARLMSPTLFESSITPSGHLVISTEHDISLVSRTGWSMKGDGYFYGRAMCLSEDVLVACRYDYQGVDPTFKGAWATNDPPFSTTTLYLIDGRKKTIIPFGRGYIAIPTKVRWKPWLGR